MKLKVSRTWLPHNLTFMFHSAMFSRGLGELYWGPALKVWQPRREVLCSLNSLRKRSGACPSGSSCVFGVYFDVFTSVEKMNHSRKCVLCHRPDETTTTGALLKKEQVTAHQNCLLFSSGIFCTNTPEFDDLFGFSVEDVKNEVKRGSKLSCRHCKKKGATAGCEVKRCQKTFHYPCAMEEGAKKFEDTDNGKYGLYCRLHSDPENRKPKTPRNSKNPNKAGPSKTYCLTCERKEGNISLDSLSNSIVMMFCAKHAPSSLQTKANGDPSAAAWSSSCSDSSSISQTKRQQSFDEEEEDGVFRRKSVKKSRLLSGDSSNTDEEGLMPPLESDFEESATFVQEPESALPPLTSRESEKPSCSSAGFQVENMNSDLNNNDDDDTLTHSDAESESLLCPVAAGAEFSPDPAARSVADERLQVQLMEKAVQTIKRENQESRHEQHEEHLNGWSVPHQSAAADPYPERSSSAPPGTSSDFTTAPSRSNCATLLPSPPRPRSAAPGPFPPGVPPRSEPSSTRAPPSPDVDSAAFWRKCNAAGCTQAIFTEFIREVDNISSRIQCDQASREDYDRALSMMLASGRLADLVTKQEEELERRRVELQRASASLKEAVSALRR
ncbi:uncharacterized protein phf11 isoform X3 [Poecilia formosa]|uniref:uncharacterized protein phf11 isoform X3 n=2 Tax=Poecilia TaxID=8080 RepID=UPI0007BA2624|nr:PREDICTED: PHD finger protein 11 isoform X3 [Poecilia formosa]